MRLSGGDRPTAEDLVQETCLALVRELRRNPDADLRIGWLITTARRRYIDRLRKLERDAAVLDRFASQLSAGEEGSVDVGDTGALSILALLKAEQRAALVFRYVDEMSVAEVAGELGRSVSATESLLARARRRLAQMLERVNHDS